MARCETSTWESIANRNRRVCVCVCVCVCVRVCVCVCACTVLYTLYLLYPLYPPSTVLRTRLVYVIGIRLCTPYRHACRRRVLHGGGAFCMEAFDANSRPLAPARFSLLLFFLWRGRQGGVFVAFYSLVVCPSSSDRGTEARGGGDKFSSKPRSRERSSAGFSCSQGCVSQDPFFFLPRLLCLALPQFALIWRIPHAPRGRAGRRQKQQ